jgi:hypothetical protein
MSVDNFKPEIWSQEILFSLKQNLLASNLVNRNYEGEIQNQGDTVRITTPNAIATSEYDGDDFTFDEVASTQQTLLIDEARKFHFQVRDIDEVQANVSLMQAFSQEASFSLANDMDRFIFEAYAEADEDNVIDTGGFDESNAWDQLTLAAQLLSEKNVPEQGRWAVVDPAGYRSLARDTAFQRASDLGDQVSREGFMGRAAGFNVWMSNNLITVEGDPDIKHYVYGHNIAITLAEQLLSIKAGEREKNFADYLKGLHVYGKKVVRPAALGTIEVDQS